MYIELISYMTGWATLDVKANGIRIRPVNNDTVDRYYYSKGDKLEIEISNYEEGEEANPLKLYDSNNYVTIIDPSDNFTIQLDSNVSYSMQPFGELVVVNIGLGIEGVYANGEELQSGTALVPLGAVVRNVEGVNDVYVRDEVGNYVYMLDTSNRDYCNVFRGMRLEIEE